MVVFPLALAIHAPAMASSPTSTSAIARFVLPAGTSAEAFNLSLTPAGCFVEATVYLRSLRLDSGEFVFADYLTFDVRTDAGAGNHTAALVGRKTGEVYIHDGESGDIRLDFTPDEVQRAGMSRALSKAVAKAYNKAQARLVADTRAGIVQGKICPVRDLSDLAVVSECAHIALGKLLADPRCHPTLLREEDGKESVMFFGANNRFALYRPGRGTTVVPFQAGVPFPALLQALAQKAKLALPTTTVVEGYLADVDAGGAPASAAHAP